MGFQLSFGGERWNASGSALAVISNFAKRQAGRQAPEFGKSLSIRSLSQLHFSVQFWQLDASRQLLSLLCHAEKNAFVCI